MLSFVSFFKSSYVIISHKVISGIFIIPSSFLISVLCTFCTSPILTLQQCDLYNIAGPTNGNVVHTVLLSSRRPYYHHVKMTREGYLHYSIQRLLPCAICIKNDPIFSYIILYYVSIPQSVHQPNCFSFTSTVIHEVEVIFKCFISFSAFNRCD